MKLHRLIYTLVFSLFLVVGANSQDRAALRGSVRDAEEDRPLVGVNVLVRGTSFGAATDHEGHFEIRNIPAGRYTVEARMIGYRRQLRTVTLTAGPLVRLDFGLVSEPIEMPGITVEAKTSDLLTNPISSTLIEKKDITGLAKVTIADVLTSVPGIATSRSGSWGTKPYIEGMTDARILVLIDGAKVNQACPMGMDACTATIEPDMIEKIQVQKGPGSVRYGSGAMGGVVDIATLSSPHLTSPQFQLAANVVGRYQSVSNSRVTQLSLSGGNQQFDILGTIGGGWHDDYRSGTGVIENSGFRSRFLNVRARYRPAYNHHLFLLTNIYRAADIGWPAANTTIPTEKRDTYVLSYAVSDVSAALRTVTVHLSYQPMFHDMINTMVDGEEVWQKMWRGKSSTETYDIRLESSFTIGKHHKLTAGADYSVWRMHALQSIHERGQPWSEDSSILPRSSLTELGVFLEDEVNITNRLKAKAGARFNLIQSDAESDPALPLQQSTLQSQDRVASGSLGLLYRVADTWVVTTSISRGLRGATPVERYIRAPMMDGYYRIGNAELQPETNLSKRIGIRGMEDHFKWSIEVFHNTLSNLILASVDPATPSPLEGLKGVKRFTNVGKATVIGGSGSLEISLLPSLILSVNSSLTWGRDDAAREPLAFMAPLQVGGSVRYEQERFWIGAEAKAGGNQNRFAQRYGEVRTPGYGVFNMRGGGTLADNLEVTLGVDNILNKDYRTHLNAAQLPEPGRNVYLTVNASLPFSFASSATDNRPTAVVRLTVEGMACEFCARTVTERLKRVTGVVSAEVSLEAKRADVTIRPGETSIDELINAVERAGFKASLSGWEEK